VVDGWPKQAIKGVAASVACDSRGRAYVGVRNIPAGGGVGSILPGEGRVVVLNPDGSLHGDWDFKFSAPHAVWVNDSDEVFVADTGLHTITRHAPSGEVLLTLGTPGAAGAPGKPFNMPTAAVQTGNGDIIVSDGYGQNWIHRFSARGELVHSWGGGDPVFIQQFRGEPVTGVTATEPGRFNLPHDVHIATDGTVFVMDRENLRWQTFDVMNGRYLAQVNGVNRPCDVAVDREGIFHIVGGGGVEIWTPDGQKLGAWGQKGAEPGQFKFGPHGCWIDAEGSLYIGEVGGNEGLQKFRRV
jgi:sugar lactone lactonase YvrE